MKRVAHQHYNNTQRHIQPHSHHFPNDDLRKSKLNAHIEDHPKCICNRVEVILNVSEGKKNNEQMCKSSYSPPPYLHKPVLTTRGYVFLVRSKHGTNKVFWRVFVSSKTSHESKRSNIPYSVCIIWRCCENIVTWRRHGRDLCNVG